MDCAYLPVSEGLPLELPRLIHEQFFYLMITRLNSVNSHSTFMCLKGILCAQILEYSGILYGKNPPQKEILIPFLNIPSIFRAYSVDHIFNQKYIDGYYFVLDIMSRPLVSYCTFNRFSSHCSFFTGCTLWVGIKGIQTHFLGDIIFCAYPLEYHFLEQVCMALHFSTSQISASSLLLIHLWGRLLGW